jgi:hypothetical protein
MWYDNFTFGEQPMSGGHFTYGYDYYKVSNFADELEEEILRNGSDSLGNLGETYSQAVIDYLKLKVHELRKAAEIMRACDLLYSGDNGEESFMKCVKEIERKYNHA